MPLPSRMSVHRFPKSLRPRIRVAQAAAWEAVVDTYAAQLVAFAGDLASRIPILDAVELYFRVVPVPAAMQEPVRTRGLVSLDLDALPLRAPIPPLRGWKLLHPGRVWEHLKFRREHHETTIRLARLLGARASEAVEATHVHNALGFTQLLEGFLPLEKAVSYYVEEFRLPLPAAHVVQQRVQATLAARALAAQDPPPRRIEPPAEPETKIIPAQPPIVGTIRAAG
ncbi:MAG TPA: hypothetical protein VNK43_02395 [Gemmatimonadales bacterium]|nr:hypothetical protein [Gemmatimonadales bacterium]